MAFLAVLLYIKPAPIFITFTVRGTDAVGISVTAAVKAVAKPSVTGQAFLVFTEMTEWVVSLTGFGTRLVVGTAECTADVAIWIRLVRSKLVVRCRPAARRAPALEMVGYIVLKVLRLVNMEVVDVPLP
jgi:hypothetical protein